MTHAGSPSLNRLTRTEKSKGPGPQGALPRPGRHKTGVPAHAKDKKGAGSAMTCPFCQQGPVSVIDSRRAERHSYTRRVRVCRACKVRWATYEITDAEMLELTELREWKAVMVARVKRANRGTGREE